MPKIPVAELEKALTDLVGNDKLTLRRVSRALSLVLEDLGTPMGDPTAYAFHRGHYKEALQQLGAKLKKQKESLLQAKRLSRTSLTPEWKEWKERQEHRISLLEYVIRFLVRSVVTESKRKS